MSWETRGKRQYLYQSYRDDTGKVRRRYVGRGQEAMEEVARQRQNQALEAADRALAAELQAGQAGLDETMSTLDQNLRLLVEAELYAAGFHQHDGTWRKKHDKQDDR